MESWGWFWLHAEPHMWIETGTEMVKAGGWPVQPLWLRLPWELSVIPPACTGEPGCPGVLGCPSWARLGQAGQAIHPLQCECGLLKSVLRCSFVTTQSCLTDFLRSFRKYCLARRGNYLPVWLILRKISPWHFLQMQCQISPGSTDHRNKESPGSEWWNVEIERNNREMWVLNTVPKCLQLRVCLYPSTSSRLEMLRTREA